MSRLTGAVLGVLFVVVLLCGVQVVPASALSSEQIVEKTKDSVVRVLIEVEPREKEVLRYYGLPKISETMRYPAGTGFVVTKNGYIVTSLSVLPPHPNKKKLYVRLPKEGDQEVRQVLIDKDRYIACLKIDKFDLVPLALYTEPLNVGNGVYALGFPYSAVTSQITDKDPTFAEGKVGALKQTHQELTLVQTDIAVNTGSTGAPLLNSDGNVVGVVLGNANRTRTNASIKRMLEGMFPDEELPVGIAFATPAKLLHDMLLAEGVEASLATPPPAKGSEGATANAAAAGNAGAGPAGGEQGGAAGGKKGGSETGLESYLMLGLGAILVLALLVTFFLFKRKPAAQESAVEVEKSPEVPFAPPPPQPSFSKSTTISLGTLRCTEGEYAGRTFSMTDKGLTIGRDNECDIRLNSDIISRRHSWIGPRGGEIAVRDMGSTNGTFLNGKKVEGIATLQKGDVVSLSKSGQEAFVFVE